MFFHFSRTFVFFRILCFLFWGHVGVSGTRGRDGFLRRSSRSRGVGLNIRAGPSLHPRASDPAAASSGRAGGAAARLGVGGENGDGGKRQTDKKVRKFLCLHSMMISNFARAEDVKS